MNIKNLIQSCNVGRQNLLLVFIRHVCLKLRYGINVVVGRKVKIDSADSISTRGRLMVAMEDCILNDPNVWTLLKLQGRIIIGGMCSIHRGCKIEVAEGASLILNSCFINSGTIILCHHSISIGSNSAIGWNCQIMDEDYHDIKYANTPPRDTNKQFVQDIKIGSHVLIGNNCFIYKGCTIANGSVVASNSVVKKSLIEENTLYAGNPAVAIRKIETWTN